MSEIFLASSWCENLTCDVTCNRSIKIQLPISYSLLPEGGGEVVGVVSGEVVSVIVVAVIVVAVIVVAVIVVAVIVVAIISVGSGQTIFYKQKKAPQYSSESQRKVLIIAVGTSIH